MTVLILHSIALAISVIASKEFGSNGKHGWASLCLIMALTQLAIVAMRGVS